ncbi:phage tail fiber protein [Dialister micraerophilus]|uniref:phage tail fiber domain-containing protein n=1 Tax=Dialister micraerophilus TaxID=309120 RepID=UPI003C6C5271
MTVVSSQKRNHLVQRKDYTVHNKQVTLKTAPSDIIEIYRKTTTEPLVTWPVLKAKDLSLQEIQLLHLAEETFDKVQDGGMARSERDNTWDGRYSRIKTYKTRKKTKTC